jgi:hypothetical protein
MRSIWFSSAAGATVQWTADRDCVLVGADNIANSWAWSFDGSLTYTAATTAAATDQAEEKLIVVPPFFHQLAVQVFGGQTIFGAPSSAGSTGLIWLDELVT